MLRRIMLTCCLTAIAGVVNANHIFLKSDIKGSSLTRGYEGQIELTSFSWGLGTPFSGGTCTIQDVYATKTIDLSSAELIEKAALGKSIGDAVITITRQGADGRVQPVMALKMGQAEISSYSTAGGDGEDRIFESIALRFSDIDGVVYEIDPRTGRIIAERPFKIPCTPRY